jgi:serine/threonine-protein kinase
MSVEPPHLSGTDEMDPIRSDSSDDTLVGTPAAIPSVWLNLGEAASACLPTSLSPEVNVVTPSRAGFPDIPGYEVLEELGRGGMGVVFKARQKALNRVVALKMILSGELASTQELDRFRREAEAIAQLRHPNIVQIYDVGEYKGLAYFSLEFCEGGRLSVKVREAPLRPAEAAALVERLAGAVQAAHEAGVVHRDLKTGNVLLLADGTPKITDFGLAKRFEAANPLSTNPGSNPKPREEITRTDAVLGTPSYMAPEQAFGDIRAVGLLADVYSLGAILYDLLTGRPPFLGPTTHDTLEQVRHREPTPPRRLEPNLPRDLETICLKCLEKYQSDRYSSASGTGR